MNDNLIRASSPELAKERKLIREIISEMIKTLGKDAKRYKFHRTEEVYGGHNNGYRAKYNLIESPKKARLFEQLYISFETAGANWNTTKLTRIVVRISGEARVEITEPYRHTLQQSIWGRGNNNVITFDRNRPRHMQANAIVRLLADRQALYDEAVERVKKDTIIWDKFAASVKRVKKTFGIKPKEVWKKSEFEIALGIPRTQNRKCKGSIVMGTFGNIEISIDDLTEAKLSKVVSAFK